MESLPISISPAEIQILNRFPEDSFDAFIQLAFEFLLNPKDSTKLLNDLHVFCESVGASAGAVKSLVKSLLSFLRDRLRQNSSITLLKDHLEKFGKKKLPSPSICWMVHLDPYYNVFFHKLF